MMATIGAVHVEHPHEAKTPSTSCRCQIVDFSLGCYKGILDWVRFAYERKHARGGRRMLYVHLAVRLNALKGDRLHFTIFIEMNM